MELPAALRAQVDRLLDGVALSDLRMASQRLTQRYRAELRDGRLHLDGEMAMKAYLAARLPATYAAVRTAFAMVEEAMPGFAPASMLDIGAGPGTALWAARDAWPGIGAATMIEASLPARRIGEVLGTALPHVDSRWIDGEAAVAELPRADLVTMAYVLDELQPMAISALTARLWGATRQVLVVIEPGTPAGWRRILSMRADLLAAGAHVVAPCPHQAPCPLAAPNWCHFARRVARSRTHRLVKDADAPWEDEKFIFLAASRQPAGATKSRVLAPPRAGKAWIDLKLCRPDGQCEEMRVPKRDPDVYRTARRADWGDAVDL